MGCDAFSWFFKKEEDSSQISSLLPKISKSLCKLEILDQICLGFLIKITTNQKKYFYVVAENEPITDELIDKNQTISIVYDNDKKFAIDLNKNERKIQNIKEDNLNVIIIEILPKDAIDENYFLLPNIKYNNNNYKELEKKEITIVGNFGYSNGKIEKITGNEFTYILDNINSKSNEGKIKAGNPIFIKDTPEVLGMTKENKKNPPEYHADFIAFILNLQEEIKNQKQISLGDEGNYIGELNKEGIPNGKGQYIFKNGEKYEGEIKDGKFNGSGKYTYANGEYYIGELENDLRHGKGTLYYKNNNIRYEGSFVKDKFEGNGKYIWESGESYLGQFINGLNEGKGKLFYKNGNVKYEGDFVNDKFEGNGKYIYEDGEYYEGQFKNGLKHGKGILYYKNGNIEYDGDFVEGKYEGEGKYFYDNGDYYIGEFKNGLCHGKGKEYDKDGNITCEGEWVNDEFVENE